MVRITRVLGVFFCILSGLWACSEPVGQCLGPDAVCPEGYQCMQSGRQIYECLPVEPEAQVEPKPEPAEAPPLTIQLELDDVLMSGEVIVRANVSNKAFLYGVEFLLDDQYIHTDSVPDYKIKLDTTAFADGPHILTAETADITGEKARVEMEVIFDNSPPEIVELSPSINSTVFVEDGPLTISAELKDAAPIELVEFRASGFGVALLDMPPYLGTIPYTDILVDENNLPTSVFVQMSAIDVLGQNTEVSYDVSVYSRLEWEVPTLGEIWGTIQDLPNGNLVFGNGNKKLYCLSPDGNVQWTEEENAPFDRTVAVDGNGNIFAGDRNGRIHSYNSQGNFRWSKDLDSPAGDLVFRDNIVFASVYAGRVYALNADSGSTIWQSPTLPDTVFGSPAVSADHTVYVGCQDHNLYAIQDGDILWSVPTGGEVWSTPVIGSDGSIYFGSNDGWLYAIHADGSQKWAPIEVKGEFWGQLSIDEENTLYLATTFDRVQRRDLDTGELLWESSNLGGLGESSPVLDDLGTVYIANNTGTLWGFDRDNGAVRLQYEVEDGVDIRSNPKIVGDRVYLGTNARNVYSIWRWGASLPMP